MSVEVGLASRDPAGLEAFVEAISTPGSPLYGDHLSASVAAQRYGAAPAQVAEASAYFAGAGLTVAHNPDGLLLTVSGSTAQVGAAFGTTFERYSSSTGRTFVSHATPATLPAGIAWSGVAGLGNSTPIVPAVSGESMIQVAGPAHPAGGAPCPAYSGLILPCQMEDVYGFAPLLANGTNGSGERIAIVDPYVGVDPASEQLSDFNAFSTDNGLPTNELSFVYPFPTDPSLNNSATNPGWALEDALDVEWSHVGAPGAEIEMTYSPNGNYGLFASVDWVVAHDAANVISMSWGEPDVGTYDAFAGPCTAVCNASSDGSATTLGPVLELAAAEGISVFAASGDCGAAFGTSGVSTSFPASDPYVTGVGGTRLTLSGTSYVSETAWSGNVTGAYYPGCENQGGGGGGYSPYPEPYWQRGLPAGHFTRGVPDVSLDAATPVEQLRGGELYGVYGTSLATPVWAGIAAIADQYFGTSLGLLNPTLYDILESPQYSSDFHDITTGNNGYAARPGWDPATGIGTPIVSALVPDLRAAGALAGGSLSTRLTASATSGAAPLTVTFHVSTTGGSWTYPVVGVSFGNLNSSAAPGGAATYTYAFPGVYEAEAYAFDSGGNESVSTPITIVVGGGAVLPVTLSVSDSGPGVGTEVNFSASVSGGTGPYRLNYSFGDGGSLRESGLSLVPYRYPVAGAFCAQVTVIDSADPVDGGSAVLPMSVGGGGVGGCGPPASLPSVVAFSEAGLPSGTAWSVALNGATQTSETDGIGFAPAGGTLPYSVLGPIFAGGRWYGPSPAVGDVVLAGSNVSVSITFTPLSLALVEVEEKGLPVHSTWGVAMGAAGYGSRSVGSVTELALHVPFSSLPVAFVSPAGFGVARIVGDGVSNVSSWHVDGNGTVVVRFGPVENLTFAETGLPPGAAWTVHLTYPKPGGPPGQSGRTTSTSIVVPVVSDTYRWTVHSANPDVRPAHSHGAAAVGAKAKVVNVVFRPVESKVTISETGLPKHTSWSVTLNGTTVESSTTASIVVHLPNGTYTYSVATTDSAVTPAPASGSFVVTAPTADHLTIRFTASTPSSAGAPKASELSPVSASGAVVRAVRFGAA